MTGNTKILASDTHVVTTRELLAFAAAIGATEEQYFDDSRVGDIVAPPGYNSVYEWPLLLQQPYLDVLGVPEGELFHRLLHAFQDTHYCSAIRPEQTLRSTISIAAVKQIAGGSIVTARIEAVDADNGNPVSTTLYGSFLRGHAMSTHAGGVVDPSSALGQAFGEPGARISLDLPVTQAHVYTECSGIWNPIHTERRYACSVGLPGVILHGTCSLALAGLNVQRMAGQAHRVTRLAARFHRPLITGARASLEIGSSADSTRSLFRIRDANGTECVDRGVVELGAL